MKREHAAERLEKKWFGKGFRAFAGGEQDPELYAMFENWAFGEIASGAALTAEERVMVTLAVLAAQGCYSHMQMLLQAGLRLGMPAVTLREVLYHCSPYIGFPRVMEAIWHANRGFEEAGLALPLEPCGTVGEETRREAGFAKHAEIFGEAPTQALRQAEGGRRNVNGYLAGTFGDIYCREGLSVKNRELITVCLLAALGCEPQLKAHLQGAMRVGVSRDKIVEAWEQCLPWIGYPRTLNAFSCLEGL